MKVKANIVVLSVDYQSGKTYILSQTDTKISIPKITITNDNKTTLNKDINNQIMEYLPKVNELELIQQIITHHHTGLDEREDEMNMIFGFLVTHVPSTKDVYWIELDWRKENELNEVLFEVVQRLK